MTRTTLLSIAFSIVAGLLTELFFQLVKYRDSLNNDGPRAATAYGSLIDASNYTTVSQYLSGGHRKWLNYSLFRLLPPLIILLLLSGILSKYQNATYYLPYVMIAAITSLSLRDLPQIFRTSIISEKLLHIANTILVLILALIVSYFAQLVSLAFIAPSVEGLVDNLWSSLLVAMLILFYLKVTNMSTKYQDQQAEETAIANYVVSSYITIKNKHSAVIDEACRKSLCSKQVLYAILIHENMNRPGWLRTIENSLVRMFRIKLTVGIAQVRSDSPLSDTASIKKAAKILAGSIYADNGYGDGFTSIDQLKALLKDYNSGDKYAESISLIITKLRVYANELFGDTK